jgi:hypothetical protein
MALAQLGAMLRYEALMQWRRRMLTGVLLGLIVVPVFAYLAFGQNDVAEIQRTWAESGGLPTAAVNAIITRYVVLYSSMSLYVVTLLMLPVLAADIIPTDRQTGVRELIDSLPLSSARYLLGKLLSLWFSLAIGGGAAMIILAVVLRILMGPFDLGAFVLTWAAILGGVGMINSGLSLLLAASQPTRRRAIALGVTFAVICLFANASGLGHSNNMLAYLNPGRQAVTSYFFFSALPGGNAFSYLVSLPDVYLSILGGLLEVGALWLIVWLWWKRRSE